MSDGTNILDNYRYTKDHEWAKRDNSNDEIFIIGITDHAQHALGDIVHVEMPSVGTEIEREDEIAVVESAKSASELYAPISGTIVEVNEALDSNPEAINSSPYEEGWILKIKISHHDEIDELLSPEGYGHYLDEEA